VILCTAGSRPEAERLADALVGERLAACVNLIGPITSVYRWRGAVEHAEEVLLLVKTRQTRAGAVAKRIRALHSYEVPEVIVVPIVSGAADYLAWIAAETRDAEVIGATRRGSKPRTRSARTRRRV
jgi:periplasmic divalent cation tolerance protein